MKKTVFMVLTLVMAASLFTLSAAAVGTVSWGFEDGLLTVSGKGEMMDYKTSVTPWIEKKLKVRATIIEEGVTAIGSQSFQNCTDLGIAVIAPSIEEIGDAAFYRCSKLRFIELPSGLEKISDQLFGNCSALVDIDLPEKVREIGEAAFSCCSSLQSIYIPASVEKIKNSAFNSCNALADVYFGGSQQQWDAIEIGSYNKSLTKASIHVNATPDSVLGNQSSFGGTDAESVEKLKAYVLAEELLANGDKPRAAIAFGKLKDYGDANDRSCVLWREILGNNTISAGKYSTLGLKSDGTVIMAGGVRATNEYSDPAELTDIVSLSAGPVISLALREDGKVEKFGDTGYIGMDLSDWENITAVDIDGHTPLGLKADGTVNIRGQFDVSDWTDIVDISTSGLHVVGLRSDGTVVAIKDDLFSGRQCDVSEWEDIIAVDCSEEYTVGLKADGTVVVAGCFAASEEVMLSWKSGLTSWENIVAVSAGNYHTVGLKSDGTVVAVGSNELGQCDVSDWRDIVAVCAGDLHTVGLKSEGTVVAVGDNEYGQCNISDWRNIRMPDI